MSNVMHRHHHTCPECGQPWECFLPGGCRNEREKGCSACTDDSDDDFEEELD